MSVEKRKKIKLNKIKPGDLIKYRDKRPDETIPPWVYDKSTLGFGSLGLVLQTVANPYTRGPEYYIEFLDTAGDFIIADPSDLEKFCDGDP